MNSAPSSAATKVSGLNVPCVAASAVPTSTGATAAGSVRGRAAISQMWKVGLSSRPLGELGEVRPSLLPIRVAALLRLFRHVEEERRVARQLLDPGQAVVGRVHRGLQHAQREGG